MSKRLAEDAKAYFDECVSLSTFDSSDISSQEDPPLTSVGPPTPSGSYECLLEVSSNASVSNFIGSFLNNKQVPLDLAFLHNIFLNLLTKFSNNKLVACVLKHSILII